MTWENNFLPVKQAFLPVIDRWPAVIISPEKKIRNILEHREDSCMAVAA